jgi:hypothetical protein
MIVGDAVIRLGVRFFIHISDGVEKWLFISQLRRQLSRHPIDEPTQQHHSVHVPTAER